MSVRDLYLPHPDARLLWLAGVLAVLWIASASGLRADLTAWGAPSWLAASLPSGLAALCCAAWIAGGQGAGLAYAAALGFAVSASAELVQFVSAGVPDARDVAAAAIGGFLAWPLVRLVRSRGRPR